MAACPPLEDIAAFLDDTLSPEERARITEHLAQCESCYEIFSGAIHFQEEEEASSAKDTSGGGVIEFPLAPKRTSEASPVVPLEVIRSSPPRPYRWSALAASVILVAGLGFLIWQSLFTLPDLQAADLVQPLDAKAQAARGSLYEETVSRSAETPDSSFWEGASFMTGVHLLDLHLSVQAKDVETTAAHLQAIGNELQQIPGYSSLAKRYSDDYVSMKDADALQRFAPKVPRRASALQNQLSEDPFFAFGLWTEAGRLSAVLQSPEFFEQRVNRRFLSAIPREISSQDHERYAPILEDLRKIEDLWGKRRPEDYRALAGHFWSIIHRVEVIQEQDQHDSELPDLSEP